ncbi:MAG: alcohol dehydrogenase catalytic domain-containing protein, partial [Cryobacterium sp.]|nr:alcohol dehydrogenase catalytic domain-containing protein [Cryobacterium sp.]
MTVAAPAVGRGIELRLEPPAEALVFMGADRPLERIAVTEVLLREGEALVAVELATVCGSDVHTAVGHRRAPAPLVLGHEQVGRIVAFGPGARARAIDGSALSVGDRVVWGVALDCGKCRLCRRGHRNKCERIAKFGHERLRRGWELSGGLATHVHLPARTSIVRVGDDLPAAVLAPASCATATVAAALDAAETLRPLADEIVVVSGCGMLGLTAIAMASRACARVIGVDPDPTRRALAGRFGARAVAEPGVAAIRTAVDRVARRNERVDGFGVALELSGANDAITDILAAAGIGATIVLAGSVFTAPPVPLSAES